MGSRTQWLQPNTRLSFLKSGCDLPWHGSEKLVFWKDLPLPLCFVAISTIHLPKDEPLPNRQTGFPKPLVLQEGRRWVVWMSWGPQGAEMAAKERAGRSRFWGSGCQAPIRVKQWNALSNWAADSMETVSTTRVSSSSLDVIMSSHPGRPQAVLTWLESDSYNRRQLWSHWDYKNPTRP